MPEEKKYEIELLFEDLLRDNVPREERRTSFMKTAIFMLIRTGAWRDEDADWRRMDLYMDYSALWTAYLLKLEGCDTCISSDEEYAGRSVPEQRKYKGNSLFEKILVEKGLDMKVTPSAYRRYQKEISPEMDESEDNLSFEELLEKNVRRSEEPLSSSGGRSAEEPEAIIPTLEEIEAAESFEELLGIYTKKSEKASSDSGRRREEEKQEISCTPETDEAERKVIRQQEVERKTEPISPVSGTRQKEERMGQEIINAQISKESLEQRFAMLLEKKLKIKSLSALPQALTEEQERLPNVERWRQNG